MSPKRKKVWNDLKSLTSPYYHVMFSCPCNADCFFCYEKDLYPKAEPAPLKEVLASLEAARKAGYERISFGSGELLLHPHWPDMVGFAHSLGFQEIALITNLTLCTLKNLDRLQAAGLTLLCGSFHSTDDLQGKLTAGRTDIVTHQKDALREIGRTPLRFMPILLITKGNSEKWADQTLEIPQILGRPIGNVIVSAIIAHRSEVSNHPNFHDGLDIPWPEKIELIENAGIFVLTENVPACRLGKYAHRNWQFLRQIARALAGDPETEESRRLVRESEAVHQKRKLWSGMKADCPILPACQNLQAVPCQTLNPVISLADLVRRLLSELGCSANREVSTQLAENLLQRWREIG